MVNIAFRVDGGKDIGMGHIMRSMALANNLKKDENNEEVFHITRNNDTAVNKLKENNFEVVAIDKNLSYKKEIKKVKEIINKREVNKY